MTCEKQKQQSSQH